MAGAEKRAQAELAGARDEGQKRIGEAEKRAMLIIDEARKTATEEAARILATAKADEILFEISRLQIEKNLDDCDPELQKLYNNPLVAGVEKIIKLKNKCKL